MEDYEIIDWPDCQYFMELEGWEANSTLIDPNEAMGIDSSTYLVSKEWLDSLGTTKSCFKLTEYESNAPEYKYSEEFDTLEEAQERMKEMYRENTLNGNDAIVRAEIDERSAIVYLKDSNEISWDIEEVFEENKSEEYETD